MKPFFYKIFPFSFFYLGTCAVLLAQTTQDLNAATRELMQSFYKFWMKTGDKHEALRKAKMTVKARKPHPYYWAGFVLKGM